jgi:methionyl-tRNA formyltransferase
LKIWQAKVVAGRAAGKPGEIISVDREGITVACGSNMLQVEIVQKPGGKKLSSADFLAGNNLQPGENFSAVKHSTSKHD